MTNSNNTGPSTRTKTGATAIALAASAMLVFSACSGGATGETALLANNDHRHCLTDDNHLFVIDLNRGEEQTFTGAIAMADSVAAVSGQVEFAEDGTGAKLSTNVGIVGASDEEGNPLVEKQEWTADGAALVLPGGVELTEVNCDDVTYEVAELDSVVGDNHPPITEA